MVDAAFEAVDMVARMVEPAAIDRNRADDGIECIAAVVV